MPTTKRMVVETVTKVRNMPKVTATTYISHCSGSGNKGYTIEIIVGTGQEIVDTIRDRRLSYGNVDIIGIEREGTSYSVIITYIIPT